VPRGQGVRVSVGFVGAECRPVRWAVRGSIHCAVCGPERTCQPGRVPERVAKLTGAGCA